MLERLIAITVTLVACRGETTVTELRSCRAPEFCQEYVGAYDDEVGLHELCAAEHGTFAPGGCAPTADAKGVCTREGAKQVYFASYPVSLDDLAKRCTNLGGTFARGKDPDHRLWLQH